MPEEKIDEEIISITKDIGDEIYFGNYPYEADGSKKNIEWIIIEKKEDGSATLLSADAIDYVRYNSVNEKTTWETSSIRAWLNKDFLNDAFSTEEKDYILPSYLSNKDNAKYSISGGKDTEDIVFLLSIEEAERIDIGQRITRLTPYAESNNKQASKSSKKKKSTNYYWWLRSPGGGEEYAAYIKDDGKIYDGGRYVNSAGVAVRPAIRINLSGYLSYINKPKEEILKENPEDTETDSSDTVGNDDSDSKVESEENQNKETENKSEETSEINADKAENSADTVHKEDETDKNPATTD